ncbi:MAG: hypothetical protein Kow0089_14730 [Desulfobulbaceae bacterium]
MDKQERRCCRRYRMNYAIIVSSARAIDNEQGWHSGEILDAGRKGIRLRVEDFGVLSVGEKLQLLCQPRTNDSPDNNCLPLPIEGMVIWEDASRSEFALSYTG